MCANDGHTGHASIDAEYARVRSPRQLSSKLFGGPVWCALVVHTRSFPTLLLGNCMAVHAARTVAAARNVGTHCTAKVSVEVLYCTPGGRAVSARGLARFHSCELYSSVCSIRLAMVFVVYLSCLRLATAD